MQSTFYEFINTYRIDYFRSHISKVISEETTILVLAYESGFNSKSTFNKYFKKIVGMSPTDYVREQIDQDTGVSLPAQ
ncbi:helix-turn-helix domain-containing protein [Sphingobacterium spiritivorum]|uniref:helix-turn-helix domain-containing protein n=1 Tax=Sphingobacterium spiritivorum TaxID=258 RepID=UPI003DA5F985